LNDIENIQGIPESLKQAHDYKTELSLLEKKNEKLESRLQEMQQE
jgi:hypothetical protein